MNTRTWRRLAPSLAAILALFACENSKLTIKRTRDNQALSSYRLRSMTGMRDGDKLTSEMVVADNSGTLTMRMKFKIGVPIKMEEGQYVWQRAGAPQIQGVVRAEAVTFLGGQDGPPSLGGTFHLIANDSSLSLYEVKVPTTPMDPPGKGSVPK
jgi:hypothetical protein